MLILRRFLRSVYRILHLQTLEELWQQYNSMSSPLAYAVKFPTPVIFGVLEAVLDTHGARGTTGRLDVLATCQIVKVYYFKNLADKEHEFLVCELRTEGSKDIRYLKIDRAGRIIVEKCLYSPTSRIASENTGLFLGGAINAYDTVTIFDKWPLSFCGLEVADRLAVLTFAGAPPTVFDLGVLLWTLSNEFSEYRIYKTMCFWHARMVYRILQARFGGTEELDLISHSRMGTYKRQCFLDVDMVYQFGGLRDQLEQYGVIDIEDEPEVEAEVLAERATGARVLPTVIISEHLEPAIRYAKELIRKKEELLTEEQQQLVIKIRAEQDRIAAERDEIAAERDAANAERDEVLRRLALAESALKARPRLE
ncbi:hypothetical protein C8R47DRAFT_1091370 [Mycena vitilis]|nr:hypothetical protein C8R47DRAFT_1161387 [Mycena vitilis]KAJ6513585.1 hypothetical protein C8R47DRAFT_1091370 [Mycena vitilis]